VCWRIIWSHVREIVIEKRLLTWDESCLQCRELGLPIDSRLGLSALLGDWRNWGVYRRWTVLHRLIWRERRQRSSTIRTCLQHETTSRIEIDIGCIRCNIRQCDRRYIRKRTNCSSPASSKKTSEAGSDICALYAAPCTVASLPYHPPLFVNVCLTTGIRHRLHSRFDSHNLAAMAQSGEIESKHRSATLPGTRSQLRNLSLYDIPLKLRWAYHPSRYQITLAAHIGADLIHQFQLKID